MPQELNTVIAIIFFAFGLVIGSFLNVCVYRIPRSLSVSGGRSVCPRCGHQIRGYDNIPVLSFIILRGKCRDCGEKISPRYPLVELICGAAFLLCWLRFGYGWQSLLFCIFAACLITLAFIDIDTQEIPDRFHFIILGVGIAAVFLTADLTIVERLIGAAAVSVPMLVLALAINGFGMGDVKLMAVSGFLLGWKSIIFACLLGCVVGAIVSIILIAAKRKTKKDRISFGPYLAIGLFVAALFGPAIINAYIGLLTI